MDKQKLIDAINEKGLHNSLITIYYNIGRALPFTAQRFPDGRVSNWYKSQYVEVHKVKPSGKGGKYGDAYGFYYRNGERMDSSDTPSQIWCKKSDTIPQQIPHSACGSWVLMDILGDATAEPTKVYCVNDILESGKYKGLTVAEVIQKDWQWIKWAIENSEHFFFDIEAVIEEKMKNLQKLHSEDILPFGKYEGKTIRYIADTDYQYLRWLDKNSDDFIICFDELKS